MNQSLRKGYDVEILFQGFPGRAVHHGLLGWSTVALLRGHDRIILLDTGPMGIRRDLIRQLAERDIRPSDVTDVLLTHSHHDHTANWTLFPDARLYIGEVELKWSLQQPWGETSVPELSMKVLSSWPTLTTISDGKEVLPHITAHIAPGHTPGCLVYVVEGPDGDVIFTGDAVKNRAELVSAATDMTYDPALSSATIRKVWGLWSRRPGTVLVPGHDVGMVQENGATRYLSPREAAIRAWFGDDMQTTRILPLTENAS